MTRGELRRREQAVVTGFVERDGDKAFRYVTEIIDIHANDGVLFRFRPPKTYEIDTLESKRIFLCRPSIYADNGDCEILFDIEDLCRYFMVEMKPNKYKKIASLVNKDFYDSVMEAIEIRPEFIELKKKIRDQALVSCFSEQYSEKMWDEYAKNSEGICLVYNLREIFINLPKNLKFYPVRYVDDRKNQYDIKFTSHEYNNGDDSEPEHLKFLLSCLTKDKVPYSSEAEWRLFYDNASLKDNEKGQCFDFTIKPKAVIMGRNIDRDIDFRKRVEEDASNNCIKILRAQDIIM